MAGLLQSNEQITTTTEDVAAFIIMIIAFIFLLNYFALPIHLLILKFFLFIDVYFGKLYSFLLHFYNPKLDFVQEFPTIYKNYKHGYFDKILLNIDVSFKEGIKINIYNVVHNRNYHQAEYLFNNLVYFNGIVFSFLLFLFHKILSYKKEFDGTFFNNIPAIAFPEKIIKQKNRSLGKKDILTNDHMPPINSKNDKNYVSESIYLSLLNSNIEWKNKVKKYKEIQKIKNEKMKQLDKYLEMLEFEKSESIKKELFNKIDKLKIELKDKKYNIDDILEEDIKKLEKINKYLNIDIQYNKKDIKTFKKKIEEKEKNKLKLTKMEMKIKEYLNLKEKQENKLKLTKKEDKYIKTIEKRYGNNIEEYDENFEEGVIYTPNVYILNSKENKSITETKNKNEMYKSKGSQLILELLKNNLLKNYDSNVTKKIKNLEKINKKLDMNNQDDIVTYDLNMQIISQLEQQLDSKDSTSRYNRLKEISKTHQFEETYMLGLWIYANTLSNMPTGPLSKLKKINPVMWYALTSINRPSFYKTGSPVYLMYEYEKNNKDKNDNYNEENELKFADNLTDYIKDMGIDKDLEKYNYI